jgi:hypothetical protein
MADIEKTPQQIGAEVAQKAGLEDLVKAGINTAALFTQEPQPSSHQGSGSFRRTRAVDEEQALNDRCAEIAAQMQSGGKSPEEIEIAITTVRQKASSR